MDDEKLSSCILRKKSNFMSDKKSSKSSIFMYPVAMYVTTKGRNCGSRFLVPDTPCIWCSNRKNPCLEHVALFENLWPSCEVYVKYSVNVLVADDSKQLGTESKIIWNSKHLEWRGEGSIGGEERGV
ncbi:hypothetical protein T12_6189 [Trichinella patagoniensis]|uniref:Uncharacterized protein n=1 Tax=Trichinella patagoniensis TaxID=990121 RepID=A0A0V1A8R7_9BILA|nr:hypothetical protein T12_6189 [Trichinella patagoniensis]